MTTETKKRRGKPPGTLKQDARRIAMKLRWTEIEIEAVRLAAHTAGEDVSHYIRTAALTRAQRDERIEDLEWQNKGVAEWRAIALDALAEIKKLKTR